jgi:molybdate transport system substrate-binding protein
MRLVACLFVALACAGLGAAPGKEKVSIAAAANLVYVLDALQAEFRRVAPDVKVTTTSSASGTLFAQIKNGAPFDVFLSADVDYPKRAVRENLAVEETLRTFATGRLVLWTTRPNVPVEDITKAVGSADVKKIALPQPRTAPYGQAAKAALEKLDLWSTAEPKIVTGESVTQTAQFVETGSADLGFVALSLVLSPRLKNKGRWIEVPPALHSDIALDHAAVLTQRGGKNPAARAFLAFLATEPAKQILRDFGYAVK